MNREEILAHLVAFPSVVGQPNGGIVGWIQNYLGSHGTDVTVLMGPEGDRANLFASVGPKDRSGIILSGHMDVVPANEDGWSSDPFVLRTESEKLYGRGTSDMKGFLACVLAAVPNLSTVSLTRPIHLAFSYDEEAGCRGVPHLIKQLPQLCAKPEGCIVGEPSGMRAIRAHKGKAAARIEVHGRSGHSSRPDQGLNAIHAMTAILSEAVRQAESLAAGPFDSNFEPAYSSLQIGVIKGGQAVNIIPDICTADIEARSISGVNPAELLTPVKAAVESLARLGFRTSWELLSQYPALSLPADSRLALLLHELTGTEPLAAVSYGTEAGLFQAAGIEAIICGPGDIARAHRANEYIELAELTACQRMIEDLGKKLSV